MRNTRCFGFVFWVNVLIASCFLAMGISALGLFS